MKSDSKRRPAASIVEDGALEGLKKRALDSGLIVNATPKHGTIESQTKTTRKLDPKVGRAAREEMGGKKKGGKK
jgi:hypothetical protein